MVIPNTVTKFQNFQIVETFVILFITCRLLITPAALKVSILTDGSLAGEYLQASSLELPAATDITVPALTAPATASSKDCVAPPPRDIDPTLAPLASLTESTPLELQNKKS